jgi:hypothetical protein
MHGGKSPGAPKGNRNAWKHGHYSQGAIKLRRYVQVLARLAAETISLEEWEAACHASWPQKW